MDPKSLDFKFLAIAEIWTRGPVGLGVKSWTLRYLDLFLFSGFELDWDLSDDSLVSKQVCECMSRI